MTSRKEHAYEVAFRMAHVKELKAQGDLAKAVDAQASAQGKVDAIEAARRSVLVAGSACIAQGQRLDLARYELLTQLDSALSQRLRSADEVLQEAARTRIDKASSNVTAKRHREKVGERLDDLRDALFHVKAAKMQDDSIELWLESREEAL